MLSGVPLEPAMPDAPQPDKPPCRLTGTDGNVFAVISTVQRALRRADLHDRAAEFVRRAHASRSHDDVLALCFEFVDVL